MEKTNVRYGVVNEQDRIDYEKQWQVQKGYQFISYDPEKATDYCRKQGKGWIVEEISNIPNSITNYKRTIFKGGNG